MTEKQVRYGQGENDCFRWIYSRAAWIGNQSPFFPPSRTLNNSTLTDCPIQIKVSCIFKWCGGVFAY